MRPLAKLRGRMFECEVTCEDIANLLGRSKSYVSERMTNKRYHWEVEEAYQIMDLLNIPYEEILLYFPPNGGLPKKIKKAS